MQVGDICYRMVDSGGDYPPQFNELFVTRVTPAAYFVDYFPEHDRKTSKICYKTAYRKFAYPTREEALNSYKIRKRRQIQHCERTQKRAQKMLDLLEGKNAEDECFTGFVLCP